MKRHKNLFSKIISIENLQQADINASKGKSKQYGVIVHNRNKEANIINLHLMLKNAEYKTSQYTTFTITDPKERTVYRLPYFPDRITHHAIMLQLEPIFVSHFTADTYSCIKGRGIHAGLNAIRKALQDVQGTTYCLKLDIKKFYPSVDHDILKQQLQRKFKDQDLMHLLSEIIDSAPGLPIGNYLSQYLANFYLSGFDHWIKENQRVKYYFRYADDLIFFAPSKMYLHQLLHEIIRYMREELKLTIKNNYQIFPVKSRGVDALGYVCFHTHTCLRKSIKKRFARMLKRRKNNQSIASYKGWAIHSNSKKLLNKLL